MTFKKSQHVNIFCFPQDSHERIEGFLASWGNPNNWECITPCTGVSEVVSSCYRRVVAVLSPVLDLAGSSIYGERKRFISNV